MLSNFAVRIGSTSKTSGGLYLPASLAIYHPLYDDENLDNDIAVLKVSEPLEFDENISSIALPDPEPEFVGGDLARISGWGRLYVIYIKIVFFLLSNNIKPILTITVRW